MAPVSSVSSSVFPSVPASTRTAAAILDGEKLYAAPALIHPPEMHYDPGLLAEAVEAMNDWEEDESDSQGYVTVVPSSSVTSPTQSPYLAAPSAIQGGEIKVPPESVTNSKPHQNAVDKFGDWLVRTGAGIADYIYGPPMEPLRHRHAESRTENRTEARASAVHDKEDLLLGLERLGEFRAALAEFQDRLLASLEHPEDIASSKVDIPRLKPMLRHLDIKRLTDMAAHWLHNWPHAARELERLSDVTVPDFERLAPRDVRGSASDKVTQKLGGEHWVSDALAYIVKGFTGGRPDYRLAHMLNCRPLSNRTLERAREAGITELPEPDLSDPSCYGPDGPPASIRSILSASSASATSAPAATAPSAAPPLGPLLKSPSPDPSFPALVPSPDSASAPAPRSKSLYILSDPPSDYYGPIADPGFGAEAPQPRDDDGPADRTAPRPSERDTAHGAQTTSLYIPAEVIAGSPNGHARTAPPGVQVFAGADVLSLNGRRGPSPAPAPPAERDDVPGLEEIPPDDSVGATARPAFGDTFEGAFGGLGLPGHAQDRIEAYFRWVASMKERGEGAGGDGADAVADTDSAPSSPDLDARADQRPPFAEGVGKRQVGPEEEEVDWNTDGNGYHTVSLLDNYP